MCAEFVVSGAGQAAVSVSKAVLLAIEATVDVAVAGANEVEGFVPAACAGLGCC